MDKIKMVPADLLDEPTDDWGCPIMQPKVDEYREGWMNHLYFMLYPLLKGEKMHYVPQATRTAMIKNRPGDWENEARILVQAINEADEKMKELGITAKITSCEIKEGDSRGYMEVHAKFDNGTEKIVVTYFADELSFSESEFIGKTSREASELHTRKDLAYLRS